MASKQMGPTQSSHPVSSSDLEEHRSLPHHAYHRLHGDHPVPKAQVRTTTLVTTRIYTITSSGELEGNRAYCSLTVLSLSTVMSCIITHHAPAREPMHISSGLQLPFVCLDTAAYQLNVHRVWTYLAGHLSTMADAAGSNQDPPSPRLPVPQV